METYRNKTAANRGPDGKFLPGNNANPKGRPVKDCSITSLLKEELDKIPSGEKQGRTWRQLLVLAWLTGAMKNPVLFKELLERVEGKVLQPIGGEDGGPIKYEITTKDTETKQLTDRIIKGGQVVSNISLS